MLETAIFLKPQADKRIKRGHHWIYSNEIDVNKSPLKSVEAGTLLPVLSANGQALGLAFFNPHALICGRLLTRNIDANVNARFFRKKIQRALSLREAFYSAPYYRLVYGDSDGLPGLVVDRFGDDLVVQMSLAGLDALKNEIVSALTDTLQPKSILIRNDHSGRDIENLDTHIENIGDVPECFYLEENGAKFQVQKEAAQKTGWFYDHRQNRAMLQAFVKQKRVLDVFSYVGGWGIQAAVAGADQVVCVDSSEKAMRHVNENAKLNHVDERVSSLHGKAIDVLKQLVAEGEKFDVVVLDPPAFIKKRKDQKKGEAAYRHMNELGIRLLNEDGILVSASCSRPLENTTLTDIVRGAARHLDRQAQLIYTGCQSVDHPVHPAIPETEYIKAQFFRIFR